MPHLQFSIEGPISHSLHLGRPEERGVSASIQLLDKKIEVSNGGFIEFGELSICGDQSEIGKSLKSEGAVGIIHFYKGSEGYRLTLQLHASEIEIEKLVQILSTRNELKIINAETPLHDKVLSFSVVPDDEVPYLWNQKEGKSVPVKSASFAFSVESSL